jgi:hypothetical protein
MQRLVRTPIPEPLESGVRKPYIVPELLLGLQHSALMLFALFHAPFIS